MNDARRALALLALGAITALGVLDVSACGKAPSPAPPPLPSSSSRPVAVVPESPRLHDARWVQARSGDPLDAARLAEAVGAAGLVAGLDDGEPTATTALAALPYADDAEIALGRLAEIARGDAVLRHRALGALLRVAGQPRAPREPLDPEGARRSGEVLLALAADASLPREDRALAVSAARALAERGYVEARRIPSDLDAESRYPRAP